MDKNQKIKLFKDVFAPKPTEHILFLVDTPHDNIADTSRWKERRAMAQEWYTLFKELAVTEEFTVSYQEYPATGIHNQPISVDIIDVPHTDLVIALTEYSASSTLIQLAVDKKNELRCASMPMVERRMEDSAFKADYKQVQAYAAQLEQLLNDAIAGEVTFSTGDTLFVDLRYRTARKEAGDCTKPGHFINFPSGEAWKAPYEATDEEIQEYGKSKTEGILPVSHSGELFKYIIYNNRIVDIKGPESKATELNVFFSENESRRNIAEFALGCNPYAVVTGNPLEDEKASGLHIGFAMSKQLGGKVDSDMHEDIIYAKGCPVEATQVILRKSDGSTVKIIQDSRIRYELC